MICPKCKKDFNRLSKGGCPICKIPLFYDSKKRIRLVADKVLVEELLVILDTYTHKRTGIDSKMFTRTPSERAAMYDLLDTTKQFLATIKEDYPEKDLMVRVLNSKIKDPWWYLNLNHVFFLRKKWYSFLMEEFRTIKQERVKFTADDRRANNAMVNQVIMNGLF